MSQQVDGSFKTFIADEAIPQFSRVKLDSDGRVTKAGIADKDIGVAQEPVFAAGDPVSVKLLSGAGTFKVIVSEALAAGARLYTESDGEVQDTAAATAFQWGTALEAATADGDIIEAMPNFHGDTAAT